MDVNELKLSLNYLVNKYIKDDSLVLELKIEISNNKVKYILAEINRNKVEAYSNEDIELIKEIAFYFC